MRTNQQVQNAITQYADTVRRICLVYLRNATETEDIFQTRFIPIAK